MVSTTSLIEPRNFSDSVHLKAAALDPPTIIPVYETNAKTTSLNYSDRKEMIKTGNHKKFVIKVVGNTKGGVKAIICTDNKKKKTTITLVTLSVAATPGATPTLKSPGNGSVNIITMIHNAEVTILGNADIITLGSGISLFTLK